MAFCYVDTTFVRLLSAAVSEFVFRLNLSSDFHFAARLNTNIQIKKNEKNEMRKRKKKWKDGKKKRWEKENKEYKEQ